MRNINNFLFNNLKHKKGRFNFFKAFLKGKSSMYEDISGKTQKKLLFYLISSFFK